MAITLSTEESEFIERMGMAAQADSLPRIAGRIWGLFMVTAGALSSSEIAQALQISRGSVSTNTRILQNLDILERRAHPGHRQDFFSIRRNPYAALVTASIARLNSNATMVREAREVLRKSDAQGHLEELETFYVVLARAFAAARDELVARTLKQKARDTGQAHFRRRR